MVGHLNNQTVPVFEADQIDVPSIAQSTATLAELDNPALESRVTALHAALDGLAAQLAATPAPIDETTARSALRELVQIL